jgi:hypothetical protein
MIDGGGSMTVIHLKNVSETDVDDIFTEIVLTGPERAL